MAKRPTLDDVLRLAERGWAVFPMSGKTPLVKWRDESTTDEDALQAMFSEHGRGGFPNIGVDCGKSGLVVIDLDVDDDKDGMEAWEELKEQHGFEDSEALVTSTGGGGKHLIFKDPSGGQIGNSTGELGPGIDVRGNGGCIVAPPSIHPDTGKSYSWIKGDENPASLPPEVVALILAKDEPKVRPERPVTVGGTVREVVYAKGALKGEVAAVAAAPFHQRNNRLNKAAFKLGGYVCLGLLDESEVKRQLYGAAVSSGLVADDGAKAAWGTIESGLGAGKKKPRSVPTRKPRPTSTRADSEGPTPVEESEPVKEDDDPSSEQDRLLLPGPHDEGNAQSVKELYGEKYKFCPAYGWLHYNGRYWDRRNAEAKVIRAIVDTLKKRRTAAIQVARESVVKAARPSYHGVRSCKELFKSLVTIDVSLFDQSPDCLNAQNGVIDLRTGTLAPSQPENFFTYCLPVAYDREADTALWLAFLSDVVNGDREMIDYLQEAVGYSITGHTWEECLFYIHGPTRAGKGVFIETLLAMLGKEPLATEVDFVTFTRQRDHDAQNFDLAPLKPCRFVAASESSEYESLNAAKLKQLTGGNDVRCAFKYKDHFSYRPQFKIWLSSNYPPKVNSNDDAAWNRLRVIRFPNSYAGREDKGLKIRLRQPDVLRAVLAWAVQGARKWYQRSTEGLVVPEQVEEATQGARDEVDFVQQWLQDCTEPDEGGFVPNKELYESYQTWCEENAVPSEGKRALTRVLKQKGYEAGDPKYHNGKTRRGCQNIRLT
jgi:putative DNA primase/helicase